MLCRLCGHTFDDTGEACHAGCPMGDRCSLICCPRCGYQMVDESKSRLAKALRRLWPSSDAEESHPPARTQPVDSVPLSHLPRGGSAEIRSMADLSPIRLARLSALGMVPGRRVTLVQRRPAAVIRIGETELALGAEMLDQIWVRPHDSSAT